MKTPALRLTILACLFMACSQTASADLDLEALCDNGDPESKSDIAALSNLQLHRGPLDRDGARIVGCLHNTGDEELQNLMVAYSMVQERGSGGGSSNLEFAAIPSGESRPFRSSQLRSDPDRFARWGTTAMLVDELEVFMSGQFELTPPIELDVPILDRPQHPVERQCAELQVSDHADGPVLLREVQFADIGLVGARSSVVIGCVTNTGEETLAEGRRNAISAVYDSTTDTGAVGGGSGRLELDGPLEPGESAFFVSSFDFQQAGLTIELTPGGMRVVDDEFQLVSDGPSVTLERSGFEP